MAKLNKKKAGEVDKAKSSFDPIEAGVYHARLMDVDPTKEGNAGPYWSWEYEIVEPGEALKRKQWNNTSLSQDWSLKQTFDAFGVPTDTDTDELLGKVVKLVISQRTIQSGARAGELGNNIDRVVKADEDFEIPEEIANTIVNDIGAEKVENIF